MPALQRVRRLLGSKAGRSLGRQSDDADHRPRSPRTPRSHCQGLRFRPSTRKDGPRQGRRAKVLRSEDHAARPAIRSARAAPTGRARAVLDASTSPAGRQTPGESDQPRGRQGRSSGHDRAPSMHAGHPGTSCCQPLVCHASWESIAVSSPCRPSFPVSLREQASRRVLGRRRPRRQSPSTPLDGREVTSGAHVQQANRHAPRPCRHERTRSALASRSGGCEAPSVEIRHQRFARSALCAT
jgi:hypothetical protein